MKKAATILLAISLTIAAGAAFAVEAEEVMAKNGMVSSAHELASRAGVEIMQKGGNAVDAAIATMLALNVVEPNASGIGGGGFMVIRNAKTGEVVFLDYREVAPASATKDMYASQQSKDENWSTVGGKAVGVPGQLMGIFAALENYGTMTFAEVAVPAIRLAEEGFEVHPMQTGIIADNYEKIAKNNDLGDLAFFEDGLPIEAGKILKQPRLAEAFHLIAEHGVKAMTEGPLGESVVAAVNRAGGKMSMDDLKNYQVKIGDPAYGTYRGYHIYSTPPASSGGTHIVQLLNILENFPISSMKHNSPQYLHTLAEAMKLIFADRGKYMADTAFVDVPLRGLTSKEYARELARKIWVYEVMQEVQPGDPWPYNGGDEIAFLGGGGNKHISTSHFSVVDKEGNIVASTNTVNYFFGSGVFATEYGFVLNNEMDDFSQNPESVNAPEPGKRPLSSMSPSIVLDPDGQPFMTLGAAGAMRIITAMTQIIMNVVDFGMHMDEAIEQPRIFAFSSGGQSGPLRVEDAMNEITIQFLKLRGHNVEVQPRGGYYGTAQGILFIDGMMNGGADSRRLGVPVGF
ncbi:MAG: gamma-glutamyltransferase [Thermovirgaceae bacterium]|jgi:gamma-glutamyltranspeptidase/glutathione hydrolase|nr:gamma-glutamyltransferase [Synergistales bacterium]MDY0178992.1 gamma-glutamyltransferase [Synergistaceae bacterium]HRW87857.1 gamma-glutamyltransferase [Thermovirgaceae bacterium]MDD3133743.1 gamma-glutamyltransferase [Synergistales bacterium]MDD3829481.1 gamma-glutamyltransferase [Synergistales bacterium]